MFELLLKVLALGIASAFSPVILGVTVALLARKNRPVLHSLFFLTGGIISAAIILALGLIIAAGSSSPVFHPSVTTDLLLGTLFLIFGFSSLLSKPRARDKTEAPKTDLAMFKWLLVGFFLNITNFDAILLYLTAAKEVFEAQLPLMEKAPLALLSTLFFLLPTLLPIALWLLLPGASKKVLAPIGAAMDKYGKYVVAVIFFGFGVYLLSKAL